MKYLRRIILCSLFIILIWSFSLLFFIVNISRYSFDESKKYDAIIVLTGGSGRIEYGLELLGKGNGKALFISGVSEEVPLGALIAKTPLGIREILGVASLGKITLGRNATNTIGNAEESVEWMKRRSYKSALIVTADYHMPRAILEFEVAMPDDVTLIPAAITTRNYIDLSWIAEEGTRNLILSEFHKLIFAKLRHLFLHNQQENQQKNYKS